jgi:hypothetical protein
MSLQRIWLVDVTGIEPATLLANQIPGFIETYEFLWR